MVGIFTNPELFPSFQPIADKGPYMIRYLALKVFWDNIATEECLSLMFEVIHKEGIEVEISKLLEVGGWREALIGAVAILITPNPSGKLINQLWRRIDLGNWMSPQLCVVAYSVDEEFQQKAERRIENWHEDYPAKSLSSLLAIYKQEVVNGKNFESIVKEQDFQTHIAKDEDGGPFALEWLDRVAIVLPKFEEDNNIKLGIRKWKSLQH